MTRPTAVIFDIGRVLYEWDPRFLYERLIHEDAALDAFLREVVTLEWHFQHDEGRDFADTSAELIARFPEHRALIAAWGPRFLDSIPGPVAGMPALVDQLHANGIPLYAITNFSHEFWPAFRAQEAAMFDRFRGVVVSGEERLVKPHAPIYHLALDRFGLRAAEAVFIDDNEANVAGAAAVGMTALHFTDAPKLRADLTRLGLLAVADGRCGPNELEPANRHGVLERQGQHGSAGLVAYLDVTGQAQPPFVQLGAHDLPGGSQRLGAYRVQVGALETFLVGNQVPALVQIEEVPRHRDLLEE